MKEKINLQSVQLTERDLEIIHWINGFGFVELKHITSKFNLSEKTAYRNLKKLLNNNFLTFERIFFGKNGVYRMTSLGGKVIGTQISALRRINLAQYHHNLMLVDLSLILLNRFGGTFIPERHLRHINGLKGVGQKGHICDGELHLIDKTIAIELELTSKGQQRLVTILRHYIRRFEYNEVWYFCGNSEIKNRIDSYSNKLFFIKTFDVNSFFEENISL